VKDFLTFFAK